MDRERRKTVITGWLVVLASHGIALLLFWYSCNLG